MLMGTRGLLHRLRRHCCAAMEAFQIRKNQKTIIQKIKVNTLLLTGLAGSLGTADGLLLSESCENFDIEALVEGTAVDKFELTRSCSLSNFEAGMF